MFWKRDPIKILRKYSHNPNHEYSLSKKLYIWFKENNEQLMDTIIFPGCGSGAYELAFLQKMENNHAFQKIIMMDSDLYQHDVDIWRREVKSDLIILNSYEQLYEYCNNICKFNVIFFHRSRNALEDPYYEKFMEVCRRSSDQLNSIHAFNRDGKDCIYFHRW